MVAKHAFFPSFNEVNHKGTYSVKAKIKSYNKLFISMNKHGKTDAGSTYISCVPKNWTKYFLGSGARAQSSGLLIWKN